jgi:CRP-like cAMP-binding protein
MVAIHRLPSTRNRPPPDPGQSPNRLLAALPVSEYQRLLPHLKTVPLKLKQILQKADEEVRTIYFPGGGVCSVVSVMEDGRMVEVATVGNEGMIGITAIFGDEPPSTAAMVQVPEVEAQTMSVRMFKKEMERRGPFRELIARYCQAFIALIMQSSACNSLHPVEQRCARWLLMTHDRVGRDEFALTQEFLAVMLGVRRPTVTLVAGALQKAGLIDYGHKRIVILDRKALEAASCECHRVVKAHFDRLLPPAASAAGIQGPSVRWRTAFQT